MTRRERMERRAERLREWASKRQSDAGAVLKEGEKYHGDFAFNTQPGHIPERARLIKREDRAFESLQKAKSMDSRADGIDRQLDNSIYSDDPNALEALAAKIAKEEAQADLMKRANAAYKKAKGAPGWASSLGMSEEGAQKMEAAAARSIAAAPWQGAKPFPTYATTNLRANIRRLKQRIETIKAQQTRTAAAEEAGGVTIKLTPVGGGKEWAVITFAEKPEREVLNALRAAGFRWGAGSWVGYGDTIPSQVRGLAT